MSSTARGNWIARMCRRAFYSRLRELRGGSLTIREGNESITLGRADAELQANVIVHDPRFYRRAALGGGLGAAEALLEGYWECDDLTALVRIFTRNIETSDRLDRGLALVRRWIDKAAHALRKNTRTGSVRNIREHYDLSNEFYRLFLDETMSYSCAAYERDDASLGEAQLAKLERICRKLDLRAGEHLLEIGSGWGGLALHAAQRYGCRVTTTTISREQHEFAVRRIEEAGLSDRVTVLLRDYRDLTGSYDKLVSIEMIEAVGHHYYDLYFQTIARLLKPVGIALLQAITIKDQRYRSHLGSVDFIRKYIFPGGSLPCAAALAQSAARTPDLQAVHFEDMTPHYVRTLRDWRTRFHARLDDVRALGFTERFIRMWNYYLHYCEAGFEERQTQVVQLMYARPLWRGDFPRQSRFETGVLNSESRT